MLHGINVQSNFKLVVCHNEDPSEPVVTIQEINHIYIYIYIYNIPCHSYLDR